MKVIPYGRQQITEDDVRAVVAVLKSDYLTQGPAITEFEEAFATYVGSKFAVAVCNGTAALHLCALALHVDAKTNVITTPITFAASANCVRYCGGKVHFADIDPDTFLLDINKVHELIESKPPGFFQGIIPVDFAGRPLQMEDFKSLADEHDLWIIEDSCHAPGGYFIDKNRDRQNCGNGRFSDLSIFSFHPVKHIACGEGGMITTNDESLYQKLVELRSHGITKDPEKMHENHGGWYYEIHSLGYNYRLSDIQASLGRSQLRRASENLEKRKKIAEKYFGAFKQSLFIKGQSGIVEGHAYHLYIIKVDKRKELYDYLRLKGIHCQIHYIPVHTLPYYRELGWLKGEFPEAETYYEECLSLPIYPSMRDEDQNLVIQTVSDFYC